MYFDPKPVLSEKVCSNNIVHLGRYAMCLQKMQAHDGKGFFHTRGAVCDAIRIFWPDKAQHLACVCRL